MTVADIIGEGIDIHHLAKNKKERQEMIYKYLELVGLNREHANRFVHEFSGGQRQRIGIARALAVQPEFIVLDEPISALDVSIQAQIVNLLVDLQKKMGLTYLFVAHDLSMVKHISDRVAVLYLGTLVELTTSEELYANPRHPYTQALLSAIPIPPESRGRARPQKSASKARCRARSTRSRAANSRKMQVRKRHLPTADAGIKRRGQQSLCGMSFL